ncbi:hypothetical protein NW768_006547 [Fusarium equiseti]|uniref:Uncharacterized protein n=1 Tax=Fusarium equiseti TaxID=61235 RepID=A0ABQ8RBT6_FUSEQ|nr:hypothetical protein NW768_006547 [Fusarium equiseti]
MENIKAHDFHFVFKNSGITKNMISLFTASACKPSGRGSATADSKVKWLWKNSGQSYASTKGLVLIGYESIEQAREEAIMTRDNYIEARSNAYNREYMIFIGQKRVKHLLSLGPSEEREDFLDHSLRPTEAHRPVLIRDIYKQQVAERLRFFEKYNINYKDILSNK